MKAKEVGVKKSMEIAQTVSYLKDLAAGMEKGELYIQQGNEYLSLTPKSTVFVEVKAKRKKDKEKFSLSLSWYNEELITEGEDIKISTEKPAGDAKEIEDTEDDE